MKISFKTNDNFTLSPFTGWTRDRWIELAEKMIAAIQPYYTERKGGLKIPNPVRWMDPFLPDPEGMKNFYLMEGYTRTRSLEANWMAGTGKTSLEVNGKLINIQDQFIEGLLSASDPESPDYIGDLYDNNQWIAEIASLTTAIYTLKDLVWAKMSDKERKQVGDWIRSILKRKIPHNNWYTFIANANYVLKALGEEYDPEGLKNCMKNIKNFYLGNGWFIDGGPERGFSVEQYNPWGFHYFLPAFVYMGENDPELKGWITEALQEFIKRYIYFFGANSSVAMWGRSWAYRPAMVYPFIWGEILDVSPLSSGVVRRLVSGQMQFYIDHDYFDKNMLPTMGWAGENLDLIDPYSQYGSPYWGAAVFSNLLLPEDHKFWTEKEMPLPVEKESYVISEKTIGMQVIGNNETGEVQIVNHRCWHQKEGPFTKYAKKYTNFSYSSEFGVDIKRTENGYNCDNMFSITTDGKKFSQRIIPFFIKLDDNYGASCYYPLSGFPFVSAEDAKVFSADKKIEIKEDKSIKITTQIYIKDFCQIRFHTLETDKSLISVREGSFPVNYFDGQPEAIIKDNMIAFFHKNRGSFIKALFGFKGTADASDLMKNVENSNTMGGKSVTPVLTGSSLNPGTHIFISISGTWIGSKTKLDNLINIVKNVTVNDTKAVVEFNDGSSYSFRINIS
jgi:hypothetical protein